MTGCASLLIICKDVRRAVWHHLDVVNILARWAEQIFSEDMLGGSKLSVSIA